MLVNAIHDERGYREVRRTMSHHYDVAYHEPDIQIADADLAGDRCLVLTHMIKDGVLLDERTCAATLQHVCSLWSYGIRLEEIDPIRGNILRVHRLAA